jgi:hypothetical protein
VTDGGEYEVGTARNGKCALASTDFILEHCHRKAERKQKAKQ